MPAVEAASQLLVKAWRHLNWVPTALPTEHVAQFSCLSRKETVTVTFPSWNKLLLLLLYSVPRVRVNRQSMSRVNAASTTVRPSFLVAVGCNECVYSDRGDNVTVRPQWRRLNFPVYVCKKWPFPQRFPAANLRRASPSKASSPAVVEFGASLWHARRWAVLSSGKHSINDSANNMKMQ